MLSGGMLRRAGIAQALVHSPDLILLDEPTAGLDPQQRLDLRETLASLAEDTPILISKHLLEDVANWDAHMIRAISAAGLPVVVTGPVLSGVAGYETWQWRRRLQALASESTRRMNRYAKRYGRRWLGNAVKGRHGPEPT